MAARVRAAVCGGTSKGMKELLRWTTCRGAHLPQHPFKSRLAGVCWVEGPRVAWGTRGAACDSGQQLRESLIPHGCEEQAHEQDTAIQTKAGRQRLTT